METLLRDDFVRHFGLPASMVSGISVSTTANYFEIEDDAQKETQLHFNLGLGVARYANSNSIKATVINYDKFITSLPHAFQQGVSRCDLIVHSADLNHFLLNELKDRKPKEKVRTKSISQLLASLNMILSVPSIVSFANSHTNRKCCFFNKQAVAPPTISASAAFNRINTVIANGLKMSHPAIEAFGFELWEFSGTNTYVLS